MSVTKPLSVAEVGEFLSLDKREVETALELGLLRRSKARGMRQRVLPSSVEEFVSNPEARALVDREKHLNATEAAQRAGYPADRFRLAAELGLLPVVAEQEWKYGTVRYYRAGDVDDLADFFYVNEMRMSVLIQRRRKEGAEKGVVTRQANAQRRDTARRAFESLRPERADPLLERLLWYLVLHHPQRTLRFEGQDLMRDQRFSSLHTRFLACEYPPGILASLQKKAAALLPEGDGVLASRGETLAALWPATPHDVRGRLTLVGERLLRPHLELIQAGPPEWLVEAWEEIERHVKEEERRRRVEKERMRPTSAVIARLLGLESRFVAESAPRRGWTTKQYDEWSARRPSWAASPEEAAVYFAALRAEEEREAAEAASRRAALREEREAQWAQLLDLPLEAVRGKHLHVKVPTKGAKRRLYRKNPEWLRAARDEQRESRASKST